MKWGHTVKAAVKTESAQEHKGSGGETCGMLPSMTYSVLCWGTKAQTHLRNTGVYFLLYATCVAGSITCWISTEGQTKVIQCWMTAGWLHLDTAQNVLQHWGRCVFAGSHCSCPVQTLPTPPPQSINLYPLTRRDCFSLKFMQKKPTALFSHVTENMGGGLADLFNVVRLTRRLSIPTSLSGILALSSCV